MIIFRYAPIKLQNLGCRVGQTCVFPVWWPPSPFSSEVRQGRQGMSLLIICGSMLSLACHPCVTSCEQLDGFSYPKKIIQQTTVIIMMIQYNHILYKLYIYVYIIAFPMTMAIQWGIQHLWTNPAASTASAWHFFGPRCLWLQSSSRKRGWVTTGTLQLQPVQLADACFGRQVDRNEVQICSNIPSWFRWC